MNRFLLFALVLGVGVVSRARLSAQCIPFSTPTPGDVTAGDLIDLNPGAVRIMGYTVDGTAMVVSPVDSYRSVVNIVFPRGRQFGIAHGYGQLTTPLGVLDYRIVGIAVGDPHTLEFNWVLRFRITGGTGLFEGASGDAIYTGSSDAGTLDGITEGVLCLTE